MRRFQDSNEWRDWQLLLQAIYFVNKCEAMFSTEQLKISKSTWITCLLETNFASGVKPATVLDLFSWIHACSSYKLNIIWDDWLNTFIFSKFLNFYIILWTSEQHLTFTFLTTFPGNGYRLCARVIGRTMHRTAIYIRWLKYRTVSRQQSSYPAIWGVVREFTREPHAKEDASARGVFSGGSLR